MDIVRVGDDLAIRQRSRLDGGVAFLLFWLAGWSVACALLALEVIRKPEIRTTLFAIGFFSVWFLAAGFSVRASFGREETRIGPGGIRHRRWALIRLHDRAIPLDQIKSVVVGPDPEPNDEENRRGTVRLLTLGQPVVCVHDLPIAERLAIAALIDQHILSLSPGVRLVPPATAGHRSDVLAVPTLPDDSTLRLVRESDAFRLWRHYQFSVFGFLLVTFIAGFWDVCVAVTILDAASVPKWSDIIPMSFHIMVGLFLLLAWLSLLAMPFCQRTWEFRPDAITARFRAFGLPIWGRQVSSPGPKRIAVRPILTRRPRPDPPPSKADIELSPRLSLALIDRDDCDIFCISPLTEGEALRLQAELTDFYRISPDTRVASRPAATASPDGGPLWDRWLDESAI